MFAKNRTFTILLLLFYILIYIVPLGSPGLFVPDETRYAEIPHEMIKSGDWVVPHLNGLRYFEKPAMGYWVYACAQMLFGHNTFAVRLPSAVSTGLTALLIFLLIRFASGMENDKNRFRAAAGALIFLSCFEVFGVGSVAVLDNLFCFFMTAEISAFYFASEKEPGSSGEKSFLVLSGIACGFAFLTKGFLAFAVPVIVIVPYLIWERRYKDLLRMTWIPLLAAIIVTLPWAALIHMREPDFWKFFFWNEHIKRFMEVNAQHKEPFWYFFMLAPGMFIPWTFLIPAAVKGLRHLTKNSSPEQRRLIRFSICWFILPFLFFSMSIGKLITYILPCIPPFAVLIILGLESILQKGGDRIFKWGAAGTGVFFGLLFFALVYLQIFDFNDSHPFSHPWKAIMLANGLLAMVLFSFLAIKSSKAAIKILLIGFSPFLFFFLAHYIVPDQTLSSKVPGLLLESQSDLGDNAIIVSDENTITAACWYLNRDNIYLLENSGELEYGLAYPDASGRMLNLKSFRKLVEENRGRIILTGRVRNLERWRDELPEPNSRHYSGAEGYALWMY